MQYVIEKLQYKCAEYGLKINFKLNLINGGYEIPTHTKSDKLVDSKHNHRREEAQIYRNLETWIEQTGDPT